MTQVTSWQGECGVVAAHQDAFEELVGAGIDLLMGTKGGP
jgi:hypothetical protein